MKLNYISLYQDQFRSMLRMDSKRLGEVVKAYIRYAQDGTEPQDMDESQFILFDILVEKYKRDASHYQKIVERNRENGKKRKSQSVPMEPSGTQWDPMEANKQHSNPVAASGCTPTPTPTPTPTLTPKPKPTPTPTPHQQFDSLAVVHSQILDAAVDAGFDKNNATFSKIIDLFAEYGKDVILYGIDACVKQGVTKLAYLQKVCENKAKGVTKDGDGLSDASRAARDSGTYGIWL